jgi:protein-S-isoprenylcysteine O-methyltransferase Ste14
MTKSLIGSLIFTVVVPGAVAGYIPYLIGAQNAASGERGLAGVAGLALIALALIALGAAIYFWCLFDFIRARGTPAPIAPTEEMVHRGLYRFVRNPMYVGVLTTIGGQALWFGSMPVVIYGLTVFIIVHLFVIAYEEPTLRRTFGEVYERYCREVPRWVPRMKRPQ